MTPAPATIPIRPAPKWTIVNPGPPTPEAMDSLVRLCVAVARQRIAERAAAAGQAGDEHGGERA